MGNDPATIFCVAAKLGVAAPEAVVFSSTETMLPDTIRSGLPSPLMSAAVTDLGFSPVAKACCAEKLGTAAPGAVVLSSTDTSLSPSFVTIRSGLNEGDN